MRRFFTSTLVCFVTQQRVDSYSDAKLPRHDRWQETLAPYNLPLVLGVGQDRITSCVTIRLTVC